MAARRAGIQPGWAVLQGKQIYLRDFYPDDWAAVHAYAADPAVVRYMSWGPNSPEQSMAFVASAVVTAAENPRTRFDLAIVLCANNELVGSAGIYLQPGKPYAAEIGYCLRQDAWGKGYASEAARLLVHFGFASLGLHRISATCDPENTASARVLQKAGLQQEGYMRGHMLIRSGWRDSLLFAMLENDPR